MTAPAPVALSCGDPAGIGPEIALAAWEAVGGEVPFVWIGDPRHLQGAPHRIVSDPAEAAAPGPLPVLPLAFPAVARPGHLDPTNAPGVIAAIEEGVRLVTTGAARALCTAPIHKAALIEGAGFGYPGHTEFLAALAGVDHVVMMLASPALRVVPATIHIPLAEVPGALSPDLLRRTVEITVSGLRGRMGLDHVRVAVAGLNPHAGEDGEIGTEERDWIAATVAALAAEGHAITGPHSADTLFHARARATYDVAICMYHDQALIPAKTLDFDGGVNVTLGLPFVRTSPDHGTALDIAGRGIARPDSLIAALRMAAEMTG
ncbi:MAG: 4-hydroxythreonine-4-phosphate dehydrogenase PdxA [Shimia sp.]